jgi:hypothetical protein
LLLGSQPHSGSLTHQKFFAHCLVVVLGEVSKTAASNNDIATLERLIDLFLNVRFLQEHHAYAHQELTPNPKALCVPQKWPCPAITAE